MELPVFFYYELREVYQNHRTYMISYSKSQLIDKKISRSESKCFPLDTYSKKILYPCGLIANSFFSDRFKLGFKNLISGDFCPLCQTNGLQDWTQNWGKWYNDTDKFWIRKNISWNLDNKKRFTYKESWNREHFTRRGILQKRQGLNLPKTDDPDFIVWSRTNARSCFRKLHRIIEKLPNNATKLKSGDVLNLTILNWVNLLDN